MAGWYVAFQTMPWSRFDANAVAQIGLLVSSASIISTSVYFLWRITTFPEIGNVDAMLIGIAITFAFFLCAWGIGSGRGNPVESSLLVCNFLHVTLIYLLTKASLPTSHSASTKSSPTTSLRTPLRLSLHLSLTSHHCLQLSWPHTPRSCMRSRLSPQQFTLRSVS